MSIPYDPPHYNSNFIFNEFDYNTDIITSNNETIDVVTLVQKSGDIMTGVLSIPSLNIYDANGSLEFADSTEQTTAFSQVYIDMINSASTFDTDHLDVIDIKFVDNSSQDTAFTTALKSKVNGLN